MRPPMCETHTPRLTVRRIKIDKSMPHHQSAVIFYRRLAVEYLLALNGTETNASHTNVHLYPRPQRIAVLR